MKRRGPSGARRGGKRRDPADEARARRGIGSLVLGYRLPILSGLLVGTSYIPFPPWALFFCLVPLWLFFLRETSIRKVFLGGFVAQYVLTLVGFNWIAHTVHEFGRMPWPVAGLALLLFCAFANLHLPLAGIAFVFLRRRLDPPRGAALALLPLLTAVAEVAYPMLFPWNLGYAWLWGGLPGYQLAEYVGFQGIGAVTIGVNLLFLLAWENRASWKQAAVPLFAALLILGTANALGWHVGRRVPKPDAKALVLIVQANIGNLRRQYEKWGPAYREEVIRGYFRLTRQGLAGSNGRRPDFVLWPESAFPEVLREDGPGSMYVRSLKTFLQVESVPLVTGGRGYQGTTGRTTNALFFFNGYGEFAEPPYHKSILLAFGEYLPGARLFPKLLEWIPEASDFARGDGPQVRKLGSRILGPQICYEGLFPGFSAALADGGAQLFVNVTNDSWFGAWQEPYQHLCMTLARGIEFRRPVVRATNTGISTVMLSDGRILERSPVDEEWARPFEVPYRTAPSPTFYQKYGMRLVPAVLLLSAAGILLLARRGRRRSGSGGEAFGMNPPKKKSRGKDAPRLFLS
jgi:apolipoprotein N-acyltransferase